MFHNASTSSETSMEKITYQEGPWSIMPKNLMDVIRSHLANGGSNDFVSGLFRAPKSLAYVRQDQRARFELKGIPGRSLVAGRFAYGQNHQIIIVGVPNTTKGFWREPAIFVFRPSPIFNPNGHRHCYAYRWSMWKPFHLRDSQDERPYQEIYRVYYPIDCSKVEERKMPATLLPVKRDGEDRPPTQEANSLKRQKLVLRIGPNSLKRLEAVQQEKATDASKKVRIQDAFVSSRVTDSIVPERVTEDRPKDTSMSERELIAGTISGARSEVLSDISPEAIGSDIAATDGFSGAKTLEIEPAEIEHTDTEDERDSPHQRYYSLSSTTTVVPQSRREKSILQKKDDFTVERPSEFLAPRSVVIDSVPPPQSRDVIVIDDDDDINEVKIEKEAALKLEDTLTPGLFSIRPETVAQSPRSTATGSPNTLGEFSDAQLPSCTSNPSTKVSNNTTASPNLYENVKIEFRDADGSLRNRKPFHKCLSARDLFDTAIEAEIIDPGARMFLIRIGNERGIRMRADVEESFQEKLIKPLNQMIGTHRGMILTIRVRAFDYDRT